MACFGKERTVKLDGVGENKIVSIKYGFPADHIRWPNQRTIVKGVEHYVDVTKVIEEKKNENNLLEIPGGGYKLADHKRGQFFESINCEEVKKNLKILSKKGCIYKEVVIVRENGEEEHYSKFDKLLIQF